MKLLKLAPALARFVADTDTVAVQVESDRCLHHWNQASQCQLCAETCPSEAITLAGQVVLDASICVRCGYCLRVCPTGVFSGLDETARLLQAAAALPARQSVDLMCVHFPTATAAPDVDAILQVGTCLAALGEAAYVGLAALEIERVGVRVEACLDCPIGARLVQIEDTVARAGALTTLPLTLLDNPPLGETRKPVVETRAIPTSRRSLLRRFWGGDDAPTSPLDGLDTAEPEGKSPPRERQALLEVLAHLPDERRAGAPFFPTLTVDDSCTACQLCANICPTGALTFVAEDGAFSLDFAPLACTNCGLCVELCAPQAIHPAEQIAYGESAPRILLAGEVKYCARCRATFAGPGDLCPTCAYRRRHPFGSVPRAVAPNWRVPSSETNS